MLTSLQSTKNYTVYWICEVKRRADSELIEADSYDSAAASVKSTISNLLKVPASEVRITAVSREKVAS